ncbi:MAG: N-methyl-D-aspartate receptor subunit [Polaromonas sp.]|nr:N-methyl-D-aspartate receptor subunit [Polaromonas sp.]
MTNISPQQMQRLRQSWTTAWLALDAQPEEGLFERLLARYSEAHRRYHTLQHLDECIARLEPLRLLAAHPGEVEVALWFHDAVYELQRHDNELQSALWASQALQAAGVSETAAGRVHALVMATCHSALPASPDERLLVDIDLSILGTGRGRFEEYEHQVREEYDWVPEALFRSKRQAVLQAFVERPFIYSTEVLHAQLETPARENLHGSIAQLAS